MNQVEQAQKTVYFVVNEIGKFLCTSPSIGYFLGTDKNKAVRYSSELKAHQLASEKHLKVLKVLS